MPFICMVKYKFLAHLPVDPLAHPVVSRLPGFLVWDVVYYSFKTRIKLFSFPFLFSSYCHSVGHRVVSIVSSGCNQSSFVLFYIVLDSLYRCINAVFNTGKSTSTLFFDIYIYIYIYTNPSARAGYDTRSVFKRSLTGLNSEFSFSWTSCLTKAEEPNLLYYLPIAGGRIIGFIHFPRVLMLCEMQSVLSRIWTRVVESISYDDNHYTTGTFWYI